METRVLPNRIWDLELGRVGTHLSALALSLCLLLMTTVPLLAHGQLLRSVPADDSHLTAVPGEIRLVFSESVNPAFVRIEMVGHTGEPTALDAIRNAGDSTAVVVAGIVGQLTAGSYAVSWQALGADGHPMRGRFTFMIMEGAEGLAAVAPVSPGMAAPTAASVDQAGEVVGPPVASASQPGSEELVPFVAESPLYVAVRALTFVGLLGLIGVAAFGLVVLPLVGRRRSIAGTALLAPAREGAHRFGLATAVVLALATLLRLLAQLDAVQGGEGALDLGLVQPLLTGSIWGWGWLAQAVATLVVVVGYLLARRSAAAGWTLIAGATAVLGFTPALSGHALSAPSGAALAVIADGIHVLSAGGWLGGLLIVLVVGLPAAWRLGQDTRGPAVAALVHAFSPTALVFAGGVVVTGIFASWQHVGSISGFWTTDYGRILLVKLAVLSLVFATGAYNFLRVRPTLGDEVGTQRLRRVSLFELGIGMVVVVITAALVAIPTPAGMRLETGPDPHGEALHANPPELALPEIK